MSAGQFPGETDQPPSPDDIARIGALADPVIRNLQITLCYHELSRGMARILPDGSNWCTVATWASRQAGQSIRKQDLRQALIRLLQESRDAGQALEVLAAEGGSIRGGGPESLAGAITALRDALSPRSAFERTSQAVARGNLKVFAEIGLEFARFLALYRRGQPDPESIANFLSSLKPGDPPDGQTYLARAFAHYLEAITASDSKAKAEWMLLANLEIGYHEQTRLQPEILEAMNAPVYEPSELRRVLVEELFPDSKSRARFAIARLMGRARTLIEARDRLADMTQDLAREAVTELLMVLELPGGKVLRLGKDLGGRFPPLLASLTNPELRSLLGKIDPTPDALASTGPRDWSRLPQRMHFIADLFRAYHTDPALFDLPFTDLQASMIKSGRRPADI